MSEVGQLQLDVATVVARIEQLAADPAFDSSHWLFRRVVECDLPRLRSHLDDETLALLERAKEWL